MIRAAVACAAIIGFAAGPAYARDPASPMPRPNWASTAGPPCGEPPGPPPVARIISVTPTSSLKRSYYVRVALDDANIAVALQARQGRSLIDAFPLVKVDSSESSGPVMISMLLLKPGQRYSVLVVGWEYPTGDFRCWSPLRIPLGLVTPT